MIIATVFAVLVGLLILGTGISLILSNEVPGVELSLKKSVLQWTAEFATAITLVAGGYGLLSESAWGRPVYLIAIAMLFLTVAATMLAYARRRGREQEWPKAGVFSALLVPALINIGLRW